MASAIDTTRWHVASSIAIRVRSNPVIQQFLADPCKVLGPSGDYLVISLAADANHAWRPCVRAERQPEYSMTNWDAIVASEGPMVWRTLWRLLADRADVEDCFQETFIAALKLSRRQRVECWSAALCSLATARAMDRLRARYRQGGRRPGGAGGEELAGRRPAEAPSTEASPEQRAVATELSERLREALAQLPARQAEIFYLHALCDWSYHELGERMHMTDNAVGVTIHRARQRLRELLGDCQ